MFSREVLLLIPYIKSGPLSSSESANAKIAKIRGHEYTVSIQLHDT